jgi:hypothetical protein
LPFLDLQKNTEERGRKRKSSDPTQDYSQQKTVRTQSPSPARKDIPAIFKRYFGVEPAEKDIFVISSSSSRSILDNPVTKLLDEMSKAPGKKEKWVYDSHSTSAEAKKEFQDDQEFLPRDGYHESIYRSDGPNHFSFEAPDDTSSGSKRFRQELIQPPNKRFVLARYTSFPSQPSGGGKVLGEVIDDERRQLKDK